MIKKRKQYLFLLVISVLLAFPVFAQTNVIAVATPGHPEAPIDMSSVWDTLIVALVPLAVAGIKKLLPDIPKVFLPVGAAILGIAANWLLTKSGTLAHSPWEVGALCGAAGVGVREIIDQLKSTVVTTAGPLPSSSDSNTPAIKPPAS